jgi:hypothetical protein
MSLFFRILYFRVSQKNRFVSKKKQRATSTQQKTRFSRALVSWSGSVVMGGANDNDDDNSADAVTLEELVKVSSARFFLSFFSILFQFCNELSLPWPPLSSSSSSSRTSR